ncbi:MAG: BrnA antitoxin family protein [Treponema sp.]|nr:BrnA antitoxin family protein [Treponema sp.]
MTDLEKSIALCESNSIPDEQIDTSDIPEINDFSGFEPLHPEYFKAKKEQISIRFNSILVDHFKSMGRGWQTKVNDFLMESYLAGKI